MMPNDLSVDLVFRGNTNNPNKAIILFHGRGSMAENILSIVDRIDLSEVIVLAPRAHGNTWYPYRFLEPRSKNEPFLTEALDTVRNSLQICEKKYGLSPDQVILGGFSQGACLAADYAARHPQKYAGLCIMSGGLIGEDNEIESYEWQGSLEGTTVYLGCDENDPHIPASRVQRSATIFEQLEAVTTLRLYRGMGHAVNPDAINFLESCIER
ncbi:MAG: putative esterase [Parcubacteria group bacterium]|nr:putative esterase [Parcubacteria group bacterium]